MHRQGLYRAALAFDGAQNPHQQLPMASTTKIMTALLTLEQPNLDQEFRFIS